MEKIPVPIRVGKYPEFDTVKEGYSFFLPQKKSVVQAAGYRATQHTGKKFVYRAEIRGKVLGTRVWRIKIKN